MRASESPFEGYKSKQILCLAYKFGPYSYSRYWTGTSLQLRLMRGVFKCKWHFSLLNDILCMSLHCKLVPVQYQEYKHSLLHQHFCVGSVSTLTTFFDNLCCLDMCSKARNLTKRKLYHESCWKSCSATHRGEILGI